jgi:hypothetical protein
MKQIKNLVADWRDLDADIKSKDLEFRRLKALEKWLIENVPDYITGKYSFSAIGDTCIRVFIDVGEDEKATINLLKWLPVLKKKKWKIEKFWRKESGYFSYRAQRDYPKGCGINYIIFFEATANIDGCVITKKRKMQTFFTTDCEKELVKL